MKKFLVIQQKMIGDVLTSTILCKNIKNEFPNAQVDYLINEHTLPVVNGNPYIDNCILFKKEDNKNFLSLLSFSKKIRAKKYDVIIDAYGKNQSNIISLLSGAKTKISYYKWYTNWIYNTTIKATYFNDNGAINSRLNLLKPLLKETSTLDKKPIIYLSDSEIKKGENFLLKNDLQPTDTIFMIGVLGSSEAKTYPLNYMAKLIDHIAENSNAKFLFNYIPSQLAQAQEVFNTCSKETQNKIFLNAYTKSLRDFLCVLKHCKALIGNEGGAVNMAKALNIPTFSIYSPQIKKEAWNLFSDDKNIGVHIFDYQEKKELPNSELYLNFKPSLFNNKLTQFINQL